MASRNFFIVEKATGPNSLDARMKKLRRNLSPQQFQREVAAAWRFIGKSLADDYRETIPVPSKKPTTLKSGRSYPGYSPTHPNVVKYNRRKGQLRRSVRFKLSRKQGVLPQVAYVKLDAYPYVFLVEGTDLRARKTRKDAPTGFIADSFNEDRFYSGVPRRVQEATDYLLGQESYAYPFGR